MKGYSILNDVLGPIMTGPSSSHTAGPGKIGLAAANMWGKPVLSATVRYDRQGSYPSTHLGQGSDFGFAAGLQGMATDHPNFRDSVSIAKATGTDIRFVIDDLGAHHPNEARIDLCEQAGGPVGMSVLSFSTGGGTFLLAELDGFAIEFDGQREKWYLACSRAAAETAQTVLAEAKAVFTLRQAEAGRTTAVSLPAPDACLLEIEAGSLSGADAVKEKLLSQPGVYYLRVAAPVVPAPLRLEPQEPFKTAEGALAFAKANGIDSLPELALAYECGLGLLSREEACEKMARVLKVMRGSMTPPPEDDPVQQMLIPRVAASLEKLRRMPVDLGVLNCCVKSAIAVMENNAAHRAVVAAPTAGASGVIPAAVIAVGEEMGCSDEQILDALWASGLVGAFIANQATFGGEVAGCQAEIGSASCMAAAGVVRLLGGTVKQSFDAAGIAMQSLLGLICDPVAGLVEFPCIERNVNACAVVLMSANMALCGMSPLVGLDETIQTMMEVGRLLPPPLRCTCTGGLCATKAGCEAAERVAKLQAEG